MKGKMTAEKEDCTSASPTVKAQGIWAHMKKPENSQKDTRPAAYCFLPNLDAIL